MTTAHSANVDLVRRCFEAYYRRDVEGLLALLHEDVEVRSLMTEAEGATYHGHDGVRTWLAAVFDIFPDWHPEIGEARDLGGAVLIAMDVTATAVTSGVPIEGRYWQASLIHDGKVAWFGFFRSEEDALAAISSRRASA